MFCQEQLGELVERQQDLQKNGAGLVVIGQGSVDLTRRVCKSKKAWFQCAADPDRESFALYGLGYTSWGSIMSEPVQRRGKQASKQGYGQDWARTFDGDADWFQLSGTAVIDSGGVVRFMHRAADVSDHTSVDTILETLQGL